MIALNPKDSAILTRVAQFDQLPEADREAMLKEAGPTAKAIGRIVIGKSSSRNPELRRAAKMLKDWAAKNRQWSLQRKARQRTR
jgi:hypothetical protein